MAQVNPGSLTDWQNGQTITAELYKQERQILYTAINDNDTNITNFVVTTAKIQDGAVTTNKIATGALDGRYYTETEVDTLLQNIILGQIPDGSLTDVKLSNAAGNIKQTALLKAGGTMTGTLTLSGSPSGINDAATKDYVDTSINSIPNPVGSVVYGYKNFGGAL